MQTLYEVVKLEPEFHFSKMADEPTRAHLNPPQQSRSQRTLERIVEASLHLLATEGPAGLTVQAVVERADSSVGSFYARFRGKEELLDYLGERVWDEALERWNEALDSRDWSDLNFSELVGGAVALLIDAQRSRSVYLSALDRAAGRQSDAYANFRSHLLAGIGDLLLVRSVEIQHEEPELAVRLGLTAVLGVIDAELQAVDDRLDQETLVSECRSLLHGYLSGWADPGAGDSVDFFDVWG